MSEYVCSTKFSLRLISDDDAHAYPVALVIAEVALTVPNDIRNSLNGPHIKCAEPAVACSVATSVLDELLQTNDPLLSAPILAPFPIAIEFSPFDVHS